MREALEQQEATLVELNEERASCACYANACVGTATAVTTMAGKHSRSRHRASRGAAEVQLPASRAQPIPEAPLASDDTRTHAAAEQPAGLARATPTAALPLGAGGAVPTGGAAPTDGAAPLLKPGSLTPTSIAVLVIAYNRPQYLERALRSIFRSHPGGDAYPVYVSQDGPNERVSQVARSHGARTLVHPRRPLQLQRGSYLAKMPGYAYLSVHYGWALRTLFGIGAGAGDLRRAGGADPADGSTRTGAGAGAGAGAGGGGGPYAGVIILEEDIEVCSCPSASAPRRRSAPPCPSPIPNPTVTRRCRSTSSHTSRRRRGCSSWTRRCCACRRSTTMGRARMRASRAPSTAPTSSPASAGCSHVSCGASSSPNGQRRDS